MFVYWFENGFHREEFIVRSRGAFFAYETPNAFDRLKFSYAGPEKPLDGRR
jgi:hypothetical protein